MKKLISILVCLLSVFALITPTVAAEKKNETKEETKEPEVKKDPIMVYMFSREQCPHCIEAAAYFNELQSDKKFAGKFEFKEIEVFDSQWVPHEEEYKLLTAVADLYGDDLNSGQWGTPYILIGSESFIGYASSMDKEIEAQITKTYEDENYVDQIANIEIPEEENNDTANTIILMAILGVVVIGGTFLVIWSRKNN